MLIRDRLRPAPGSSAAGRFRAPWILVVLVAFKLVQEWVLHGARILDRFVLSDVVDRMLGRP